MQRVGSDRRESAEIPGSGTALGGAVAQDGLDRRRVIGQLGEALAQRAQGLDDGLAGVLLQRAGSPSVESARGAAPIEDGDTIWVPEQEPRSTWTIVREFVAFVAQVATIAIIIDQVSKD